MTKVVKTKVLSHIFFTMYIKNNITLINMFQFFTQKNGYTF